MPPGSPGRPCARRPALALDDTGTACDFRDRCPVPLVCASAASATKTVRTPNSCAITLRVWVVRVTLPVMGDLLCQRIKGLVRLHCYSCWDVESSAQNAAAAREEDRQYD